MGRATVLVLALLSSVALGVPADPGPTWNATAGQHACWVFDAAATMADYAAQLSQAHNLTLEQATSNPSMFPDKLVQQLQESLQVLDALRVWISSTRSSLGRAFTSDPLEPHEVVAALSPPDLLLEPHQLEGLSSIEAWSGLCHKDVIVQPLMAAFKSLSAQLTALDVDLKAQSLLVFGFRSQRAEAAGQLEALELLLELNTTARRETLAGLHQVMDHIDGKLWSTPSLRKQVVLILSQAMLNSQRSLERALGQGLEGPSLQLKLADARQRLRRADETLLQEGRKLKDLIQERKDLADSMRQHVKSMLAQCMPPDKDQPRSRYARFATSSPTSSAVQLTLEVPAFIAQSVSSTVPDLVEAMHAAIPEAHAGYSNVFLGAPSMSRWQEWLPDDNRGIAMGGFQEFIGHYQDAVQAYDKQLTEGGRLAALHSMWLRWGEVESDYPSVVPAASRGRTSAAQSGESAGGEWKLSARRDLVVREIAAAAAGIGH